MIAEFNTEQSELVTVRTFKIALNSLKVLTQYNIDNLAKYMDKQNDGFVSIADFSASVNNAFSADQTMKSSNMGATGRSNKWA